jgi:MerR family transcriptional regulator, light-induced transcriptional regulator
MSQDLLVQRLLEALVSGDRQSARGVVTEAHQSGATPPQVLTDLLWPAHQTIEKLHRGDQMTRLSYHLSTRLLRMLVDQTAGMLTIGTPRNETVFAACGPSEGEELAGQMACDLLEAAGFGVTFVGGGVPADELLARVQETRPDILVLFASAASDLPGIREIIDTLRVNGACRSTRVVVGGGVFNRAEGLAEEIGAGQWAYSPGDLVDLLTLEPEAGERIAPPAQAAAPAAKAKKPRNRAAA